MAKACAYLCHRWSMSSQALMASVNSVNSVLFLLLTSVCTNTDEMSLRWVTVVCVTDHESAAIRLFTGQPLINHTVNPYTIVPRWCWAGNVRLSYYKRREEFLTYSKVADTIWWHCGVVNWNPEYWARKSGTDSVGRPSLELSFQTFFTSSKSTGRMSTYDVHSRIKW